MLFPLVICCKSLSNSHSIIQVLSRIFQDFKIKFQFDQELLFIIICKKKCNPGSETASLMCWLCALDLGFPEIPGCGGTEVPRSQS